MMLRKVVLGLSSCPNKSGNHSILSGVQTTGPGPEHNIRPFGVFGQGLRAIPVAGAAVNAFLAVEIRHVSAAWSERLTGASFNAYFGPAFRAQLGVNKSDVIRIAGRSLHLAADQQRVLV